MLSINKQYQCDPLAWYTIDMCEGLEDGLTCSICYESFTTASGARMPRHLHCGHVYCGLCVKRLIEDGLGKSVRCPTCTRDSRRPPHTEELRLDHFVVDHKRLKVMREIGMLSPSQRGSSYTIFLRDLSGRTLSVSVRSSKMAMSELYEVLTDLTGVPLQFSRYSWQGKTLHPGLHDDSTLAELGVFADSTIFQIARLLGGGRHE